MSEYYVESANEDLGKNGIEFFPVRTSETGAVALPHIHPSLEFIYVKKGVFEITVDNRHTFTAYPGSMLIFRANTIHTISHLSGENSLYYVLKISPSLVLQTFSGDLREKYSLPFLQKRNFDIVHIDGEDLTPKISKLWEEMISEATTSETFFISQRINASRMLLSLSCDVLAPVGALEEKEAVSEHTVEQIYSVLNYVNKNFSSDIKASDCAARMHFSYGYFAKIFRAVTGKTFKEYLFDLRMSYAHTMLISSNASVTEIASECGYSSLAYFVSEYKRVFGKTPKTTQKNAARKS